VTDLDDQPPRRSPRVVDDGIIYHRTRVRTRGGAIALCTGLATALVGAILLALPGTLVGFVGFALVFAGLPVLPMTGVPIVSSTTSYLVAIVGSSALWFALGHVAARRATRRAVAGWPEWSKEIWPLALGVWAGSLLALALGAVILGAL
jgi:hypothetical protein